MMVREIRKFIPVRKIMLPVGIVHGNLGFTSGKKIFIFPELSCKKCFNIPTNS